MRPALRSLAAPVIPERDGVRRLLQRVGLGPRPGEMDAAARAGFDATLDTLLTPPGRDAGAAATPPPSFGPPERKSSRNDPDARKEQRRDAAQLCRTTVGAVCARRRGG